MDSKEKDNIGIQNENYLIIENMNENDDYIEILSKYDNKLVFSNKDILIYKIIDRHLFLYPEFTDVEKRQVQISETLEHLKRRHLNTNYGNT